MNTSRPAWQRVGAMLLCLVFVCAFYGSLTVQAVFGVDDIVIGGALVASAAVLTYITVVGLSGSDLAQPLYDAANRANTDINDWLEPKVTAFLEATDGTTLLETQIKSLVGGLSYAKDGVLYFSDKLAAFIHDFGEWLINNGDIEVTSSEAAYTSDGGAFSSRLSPFMTLPFGFDRSSEISYTSLNGNQYFSATASEPVFCAFFCDSQQYVGRVVFALDHYFSVTVRNTFSGGGSNQVNSYTYDDKTVYYFTFYTSSTRFSYDGSFNLSDAANSSVFPSDIVSWCMVNAASSTGASNGLDVWNQDTPAGFAVDPTDVIGGSIGAADIPAGAIAGIGDYLQAIADAIAGIADISLPVAGVGDIAIDPAIPADVAIPVTPAIPADIADAVPATGEATPAYPATGDYTLPLADFFPFCIPFDLYKMLSLLSASPQAPAFTWQFYTPGGGSIPIEVDLSAFDSVAAVLRAVETLAFCVGLGFVTKKLLFGS